MSSRSPITSHVLDATTGRPAEGVAISLYKLVDTDTLTFQHLADGSTNEDGRCQNLLPARNESGPLEAGTYRVRFMTKAYFDRTAQRCFYPFVEITFELSNPEEHHHIPLLLAPASFTTYRGS